MLKGKKILLGVTGGIAAYKAAILIRALVKDGAEVKVIMTPMAKQFVTPLTLATLCKNPILVDFFDPENGAWNSHVSLGEWADAFMIAPATANTIAKMANGIADNLLLTTYLSARCPVYIAPTMDLDMYAHPATQENIEKLRSLGVGIVEPGDGELASGLIGKGRMAEPEIIAEFIRGEFSKSQTLVGKRFVITAGATIEPIDPVRYITNHSTGKMGYALASELVGRGASVVLVSGRTNLPVPFGVERVDVVTAQDMYDATIEVFKGCDAAIMCAAVADYTPLTVSDSKLKKSGEQMQIVLTQTKDIAAELGKIKEGRLLVGFALETDNERSNAESKLKRKRLDMIVLNSLKDSGAGFGCDTNKVTIISKDGSSQELPLQMKSEIARHIIDKVESYLNQ